MSRKYLVSSGLMLLLGSLITVDQLAAQGPTLKKSQRPVTSPYLNLLNRGNNNFSDPGLNYYRNVRPEQEWRQGLQQQDRQLQGLAQQFARSQQKPADQTALKTIRSTIGSTGHTTSFQNRGGYFSR